MCNDILRDDQIAYIFGHTMLQTQPDGSEKQVFAVIGKKSAKQPPEGFYTILLMTGVEYGTDGDNKHYFITRANNSTVKTPVDMFKDYKIPNSLKLVDTIVREFYGMQ